MKKQLLLGALFNALFLVVFAFIYAFALRPLVVNYDWASFAGEFWFFLIMAFVLPIVFFIKEQRRYALGGVLGILGYLLINSLLIGLSGLQ